MVNLWQCSPGAFDSITVPDIVSFVSSASSPHHHGILGSAVPAATQPLHAQSCNNFFIRIVHCSKSVLLCMLPTSYPASPHPSDTQQQQQQAPPPAFRNPFLPYEEELWVQHLSDSHTLLLNKFNVVPHHVLVVTRQYESQQDALNSRDLAATQQVMERVESVLVCLWVGVVLVSYGRVQYIGLGWFSL
mgnify:CR=1 FL=1